MRGRARAVLTAAVVTACGAAGVSRPESGRATPAGSATDAGALREDPGGGSLLDAALRLCRADESDPRGCVEECDRGLVSSCAEAAARFEKGRGADRDLPRAARLYERACDGRDAAACMALAGLYASGDGVTRDVAKQSALLERACDLGYGAACWIPAKRASGDKRRALLEKGCGGGDERCCEVLEKDGGA
jgi:TPR repeat protein